LPPSGSPADPPASDCRATSSDNTWNRGFTAAVTVEDTGAVTVDGWSLNWACPGDQKVTSAWNATVPQPGDRATARNAGYDSVLAPGTTTSFGFQASDSGSDDPPEVSALNGACGLG
jgi:endoglucanase